jgi:hypothetical protein
MKKMKGIRKSMEQQLMKENENSCEKRKRKPAKIIEMQPSMAKSASINSNKES